MNIKLRRIQFCSDISSKRRFRQLSRNTMIILRDSRNIAFIGVWNVRSINGITMSVAQANSRVFTDWLKRLISMSKEESSWPKRSYQSIAGDSSTRISKPYFDFTALSFGPVTLAVDPSNFPRACRQKIHNEDQESLVFVDKPAIGDSVKSVFSQERWLSLVPFKRTQK